MPTYQYACKECGHRFETVQSFSEASLSECPQCSGILRKLYGSVGVIFKGSGFYRNDSRSETTSSNGNGSSSTNGNDSGGDSASSDSGSSGSGDSSSSGSGSSGSGSSSSTSTDSSKSSSTDSPSTSTPKAPAATS